MCREGAGSVAVCGGLILFIITQGGVTRVSGFVPQMASPHL